MSQDLSIGQEVMRISANDVDNGQNSVVRYNIVPTKKRDEAYFKIDSIDGVIHLGKAIDVRIIIIIAHYNALYRINNNKIVLCRNRLVINFVLKLRPRMRAIRPYRVPSMSK